MTTTNEIANREAWLQRAEALMAPWVAEANDAPYPAATRVACGWPKGGGKRIGECWDVLCSDDQHFEMFISPKLADPILVLGTLIHEMVHAAVGIDAGHKAPFAKVAKALGLEGKMTATTVSERLAIRFQEEILPVVGPYPHAALNPVAKKVTAKTYLLKATCLAEDCGFNVRVTKKQVERVGAPCCPLHGPMHIDGLEDDDLDEVEGED